MSAVRYLLDENVNPALRAQLIRQAPDRVVWLVGDPGAPKRGTLDPEILFWCKANGFMPVTGNRRSMVTIHSRRPLAGEGTARLRSMPIHLQAHLAAGRHVPGILALPPDMALGTVLEQLLLIWGASEAEEYQDLMPPGVEQCGTVARAANTIALKPPPAGANVLLFPVQTDPRSGHKSAR